MKDTNEDTNTDINIIPVNGYIQVRPIKTDSLFNGIEQPELILYDQIKKGVTEKIKKLVNRFTVESYNGLYFCKEENVIAEIVETETETETEIEEGITNEDRKKADEIVEEASEECSRLETLKHTETDEEEETYKEELEKGWDPNWADNICSKEKKDTAELHKEIIVGL